MNPQLYVIEYQLHGKPASFIIRLEKMDNTLAWHWASCDAGVGIIPKFGRQQARQVSKPMAERYGITEVKWRLAGQRNTAPAQDAATQSASADP